MTEQEYMDATDLARVRAATSVLSGMLCQRPSEEKTLRTALRALDDLSGTLTKRILVQQSD